MAKLKDPKLHLFRPLNVNWLQVRAVSLQSLGFKERNLPFNSFASKAGIAQLGDDLAEIDVAPVHPRELRPFGLYHYDFAGCI